MTQSY